MLLDLFFPKFCISCRKIGKFICFSCREKIYPVTVDICPSCHKPSLMGYKHSWCKSEIDGCISLFEYRGLMKTIVKTIKYKLIFSLWEEITEIIPEDRINTLSSFKKQNPNALLQIIPLHEQRLKSRGFNQIEPFQKYLSTILTYKSIKILKRVKNTNPQALIKEKRDRLINIQNAFTVISSHKIEKVILLDDIYTTGNTTKEAARTLKESGVKEVFVITLARD